MSADCVLSGSEDPKWPIFKKCEHSMIFLASLNLNLALDCSKAQWEVERRTMFRFLWAKSLGKGRGDCYSFLIPVFISLFNTNEDSYIFFTSYRDNTRRRDWIRSLSKQPGQWEPWLDVCPHSLSSLLLPPFLSLLCGFARFRKKEIKTGCLDKFEFQTNEE